VYKEKENKMERKLTLPILTLALALLACSVQINPTNPPPATDTAIPPIISTDTLVPTIPGVDTLSPTITMTDTLFPTIPSTDTPVPIPTITKTPILLSPTPSSVPSSVPELSVDILRNATYYAPFYKRTVKLVNGSYSEGSGATAYSVQILNVYAYGDLNGDGKVDAAVILAENGGGSGTFESVAAVINLRGAPHQTGQVKLGDRVLVKSANIAKGVIHLNMLVQGPNDPLCCPSQAEVQSFWLLGNDLWLMDVTSGSTGVERSINITYPGNWVDVTNPFTVSGNVPISPFENTLNYAIYLLDGTKVNESSVLVSSAGMGTPGTFTKTFDLSSAGITGLVVIQFKELSAADGSILALDSVVLNLH
jgi:hypothetical protein